MVNSHFLHADNGPIDCGDPLLELLALSGSVTFDADILGVIVLDGSLDGTDTPLGAPVTVYVDVPLRGPDFVFNSDIVVVENNLRTIHVQFASWDSVDQIRVITAVPEPGTVMLLLAGALATIIRRR
jgi:hypothetical protein